MFTGLVEEIGFLLDKRNSEAGMELSIKAESFLKEIKIGDSIMVNGVCLTVTKIIGNGFWVFASPETMQKTNLSGKERGQALHLERAMRLDNRLDGHLVTGHIDGIGTINEVKNEGKSLYLRVNLSTVLMVGVVAKGSIAIDGVSLTVNEVHTNNFSIMIIPETQKRTSLSHLKIGEQVNVELDIIGKYVQVNVAKYFEENSKFNKSAQIKPISESILKQMGY